MDRFDEYAERTLLDMCVRPQAPDLARRVLANALRDAHRRGMEEASGPAAIAAAEQRGRLAERARCVAYAKTVSETLGRDAQKWVRHVATDIERGEHDKRMESSDGE